MARRARQSHASPLVTRARMPGRCASSLLLVVIATAAATSAARALAAAAPGGRVADFSSAAKPGCAGSCTPDCPCASLQEALDAAADNDTVWLVPPLHGMPAPCEGATTEKSITVAAALWVPRPMVLDCAGRGVRALWFDGRSRAGVLPAVLANVTVRGGRSDVGGCVRADEMALEVHGCVFEGCEARGEGGLAGTGGGVAALFSRPADGARVRVHDSAFSDCSAAENGGGLAVAFNASGSGAGVEVRYCRFARSLAVAGGGLMVRFRGAAVGSTVAVLASSFAETRALRYGGAAYVELAGQAANASVRVEDSRCNGTRAGDAGGALVALFAGSAPHASLSLTRSTFTSTNGTYGGAVAVWFHGAAPHVALPISHCTFQDSRSRFDGGAVLVLFTDLAYRAAISLSHSAFVRTRSSVGGGAMFVWFVGNSSHASVLLHRSAFVNTSGGADGGAVGVLFVGDATRASVVAEHSTFWGSSAGRGGGALYLVTYGTRFSAQLLNCTFHHCSAVKRGGAVFAALARQQAPLLPVYCTGDLQQRRWAASSRLLVQDCAFHNVSCTDPACKGGAIDLAGGLLNFSHSSVSLAAARAAGGFLHTSAASGAVVHAARVTEAAASKTAFIDHEGAGALAVTASLFAAPRRADRAADVLAAYAAAAAPVFDNQSVLQCNAGETFVDASLGLSPSTEAWQLASCGLPVPEQGMVAVESVNMQWQCVPCPADTYFLGAGQVRGGVAFPGNCTPCPFGATCRGGADMRANPGMWGTASARAAGGGEAAAALPDALIRCEAGYCCRDAATCTRYDSCAPGRTGLLCGDCEAGTVGVLGSAACRPRAQCGRAAQDVLFWPGTALLALAFLVWQLRTAGAQWEAGSGGGVWRGFVSTAAIKSTFAFVQCFPLLAAGDVAGSAAMQTLRAAVTHLFSLQLHLGGEAGGVCVLGGLSPTAEQAFKLAMGVLVLACGLPAVWVAHWLLGWFGPRWTRLHPPHAHVYAGALTAMIMLTFSVVTGAATKLVACVPVPAHGSRLLIQGSVECWTRAAWWQWGVAAWAVTISFMPLSVGLGGWLLRRAEISPAMFWLSLLLPLPCVLLWCVTHCLSRDGGRPLPAGRAPLHQRRDHAEASVGWLGRATLLALEAGYRAEAWWWDAVLLLRRVALLALPLLLRQTAVLHAVAALLVVALCLVAHVKVQPMASVAANAAETGYLLSLLLMAALTIRSGTLLSIASRDPAHSVAAASAAIVLLVAVPLAALATTAWWWVMDAWARWRRRGRTGEPCLVESTRLSSARLSESLLGRA